jgi:hypothetical protein
VIKLAKKDYSTPDEGRVKFRVIEFEVEGANDTLAEGIRSLAATLNRGNGAGQTMRVAQQPNGSAAPALGNGSDIEEESEYEETTIEGETTTTPRKPAAPRKPPVLKLVKDIDWAKPEPSLKDFLTGLDLNSATRKYAAIAHWFKEYRDTPAITVDHIYSAYKHMGWTDLARFANDTLQDLKNKREYKWLDAGSNRGEYAINPYGDQEVAKWRKEAS